MKVQIIKDYTINRLWARKGQVLKARLLSKHPFDLSPQVQVIEGTLSGEFIPKEIFIGIPEEKTYTEKEWNDLENHYLNLMDKERNKVTNQSEKIDSLQSEKKRLENEVDEARELKKAVLPLDVYEVFTRVDKAWNELLDNESVQLLFLSLVSLRVDGDALVLKKFAIDYPATYMKAILNGCSLSEEDKNKLEIRRWYKGALIREEDRTDPDGFAKEAIEEVALYLGGAEILADLSPYCRNQLSKKKAN